MTIRRTLRHPVSALALAAIVYPGVLPAADFGLRLNGSIIGFVTGPSGAAQMGATVLLLNSYEQVLNRTLTNERGAFGFEALPVDKYTVRVSQTSFAPTAMGGISVTPGRSSFLSIQLATLVSSMRLMPAAPGVASLMTEEWKWVLRGGLATRPVLRFLPGIDEPVKSSAPQADLFSETHGLLKLSAGEMGTAHSASLADMGTAFALATSVLGSGRVMFSGNVGYSPANGVPAAGFRTSWRRSQDSAEVFNPEMRLTVQQVNLPALTAGRLLGPVQGSLPALRTMSAGVADQVTLSERVHAEVGVSLDSVNFLSRMNYISPYIVASTDLGEFGSIETGFSDGLPPAEMYRHRRDKTRRDEGADLHRNVNALSVLPRVSMRDGAARLQRATNYEVGYRKRFGDRAIEAAVYRESISDAALTMSAPDGMFGAGDLLPDFNSRSSIFNIGDLERSGFTIAGSQGFSEVLTVDIIFSRGGVLRSDQRMLSGEDAGEIRSSIRHSRQNAIASRVSGELPRSGTRYAASYQWTDYRALTPGHLYLTGIGSADVGLNFALRQPVPPLPFLSGRMEISAELRNMLAQGYLPLTTSDGRPVLLIHTPRMVRGGVSFSF